MTTQSMTPVYEQMEFYFGKTPKEIMRLINGRLKDAEAERDYFDLYELESQNANREYVLALEEYISDLLDFQRHTWSFKEEDFKVPEIKKRMEVLELNDY